MGPYQRSDHLPPDTQMRLVTALRKALDHHYTITELKEAAENLIRFLDGKDQENWERSRAQQRARKAEEAENRFQAQMRHAIWWHTQQHQKLKDTP